MIGCDILKKQLTDYLTGTASDKPLIIDYTHDEESIFISNSSVNTLRRDELIASFTKNVYVDLANEYANLVIKLARVKYYFDYTPSQRWAMKCQM